MSFNGNGDKFMSDGGEYKYVPIPDNVVLTTGDQEISGNKSFTSCHVENITVSDINDIRLNLSNDGNGAFLSVEGTANGSTVELGIKSYGDGTRFLADDGQYKEINQTGEYLPLYGGTVTGTTRIDSRLETRNIEPIANNNQNVGTLTSYYANTFCNTIFTNTFRTLTGSDISVPSLNGVNLLSSGDGNSYLSNNGAYKSINSYSIQSIVQQTAITLTNGTFVSIITLIPNKTGTMEVDFSCSVNATISAVLATLTSDAVFGSLTVEFRNNGVSEYSQTCQVGRSGTSANDVNYVHVRRVMNVTQGLSVQIYIRANETGMSIPANGNTTLLIKG